MEQSHHKSFVLQRSVYVGSRSGVVQVPMSSCQRYTSCYDCVFARDPFCGWDGKVCVEISSRAQRWGNTHTYSDKHAYIDTCAHTSALTEWITVLNQKTKQIVAEMHKFALRHRRSWVCVSPKLLCGSTCLFCLLASFISSWHSVFFSICGCLHLDFKLWFYLSIL